jgi:hypothetical protein
MFTSTHLLGRSGVTSKFSGPLPSGKPTRCPQSSFAEGCQAVSLRGEEDARTIARLSATPPTSPKRLHQGGMGPGRKGTLFGGVPMIGPAQWFTWIGGGPVYRGRPCGSCRAPLRGTAKLLPGLAHRALRHDLAVTARGAPRPLGSRAPVVPLVFLLALRSITSASGRLGQSPEICLPRTLAPGLANVSVLPQKQIIRVHN